MVFPGLVVNARDSPLTRANYARNVERINARHAHREDQNSLPLNFASHVERNRSMKSKPSSIPCAICNRTPTDSCHIKTNGSGGTMEDYNIIQMCRLHHNEQHNLGWNKMVYRYPHLNIILESKGWELRNVLGVVKLVRDHV